MSKLKTIQINNKTMNLTICNYKILFKRKMMIKENQIINNNFKI
jgi:hypothetical protein